MKKQVIAPSGFKFPHFPYNSDTLVKIKDTTNYRADFLNVAWDKKSYGQADFDHDLFPEALEIEVEDFDTMFKVNSLKKLGIKKPPTGWQAFHSELCALIDEGDDTIWSIKKPIHKQLLQLGLLKQLPESKMTKELYFFSFTVKELKKICGKQGIKKAGSKPEIVERILKHGRPKAKPTVSITDKYFHMVEKLSKYYLKSIEDQLIDKPKPYAIVVWDLVSEEYGIGEQLPNKARIYAEKKFTQIKPDNW